MILFPFYTGLLFHDHVFMHLCVLVFVYLYSFLWFFFYKQASSPCNKAIKVKPISKFSVCRPRRIFWCRVPTHPLQHPLPRKLNLARRLAVLEPAARHTEPVALGQLDLVLDARERARAVMREMDAGCKERLAGINDNREERMTHLKCPDTDTCRSASSRRSPGTRPSRSGRSGARCGAGRRRRRRQTFGRRSRTAQRRRARRGGPMPKRREGSASWSVVVELAR